jgi:hypothetical protein
MNWEDLKVYSPLKTEDLKSAYKDFTKIIANNLRADGFELKGKKLIKLSNDLFHIVHIDTRGSWVGTSESYKTEISICSVYDTDTFISNFELTASRKIEDLIPKIRNHYRITQEYPLLADFLTRKIRESIFPYFSQYKSSRDVLDNLTKFKLDNVTEITERNTNLILYCALANRTSLKSSEILEDKLTKYRRIKMDDKAVKQTEVLLYLIQGEKWEAVEEILDSNKRSIFNKLKIKLP